MAPRFAGVTTSTGGIIKRSLAMAYLRWHVTIANACGLDDATQTLAKHLEKIYL